MFDTMKLYITVVLFHFLANSGTIDRSIRNSASPTLTVIDTLGWKKVRGSILSTNRNLCSFVNLLYDTLNYSWLQDCISAKKIYSFSDKEMVFSFVYKKPLDEFAFIKVENLKNQCVLAQATFEQLSNKTLKFSLKSGKFNDVLVNIANNLCEENNGIKVSDFHAVWLFTPTSSGVIITFEVFIKPNLTNVKWAKVNLTLKNIFVEKKIISYLESVVYQTLINIDKQIKTPNLYNGGCLPYLNIR